MDRYNLWDDCRIQKLSPTYWLFKLMNFHELLSSNSTLKELTFAPTALQHSLFKDDLLCFASDHKPLVRITLME